MIQLRSSGLVSGEGRLRVNGKEMTALDATSSSDQMESVEVLEGVAAVELTRVHEEDWNKYDVGFPVRVGFRDKSGNKATHFIPSAACAFYLFIRGHQRATSWLSTMSLFGSRSPSSAVR